jgi:hypothetical protein
VEVCLQGEELIDEHLLGIAEITILQNVIKNTSFIASGTLENCAHLLYSVIRDNLFKIKSDVSLARVCVWGSPYLCVKYSANLIATGDIR